MRMWNKCVCVCAMMGLLVGCGVPAADPSDPDAVCATDASDDFRGDEADFSVTFEGEGGQAVVLEGRMKLTAQPIGYAQEKRRLIGTAKRNNFYYGFEVLPSGQDEWVLISREVASQVTPQTSHVALSCKKEGGAGGTSMLFLHELLPAFGADVELGDSEWISFLLEDGSTQQVDQTVVIRQGSVSSARLVIR